MENPLLTVAFIVAATSFFKTQFNLANRAALVCAFVISLVVAFLPLLGATFPAAAPWLDRFVLVIGLFIGAAGAWDTARAFQRRPNTSRYIGP